MYVPVRVLAATGLVVLGLLLLLVARRRSGARDLIAPPRLGTPAPPPPPLDIQPHRAWPAGAAPIGDVPPEIAGEVRDLCAAGKKLEAIKLIRAATDLALAEAKDMVERM